MGSVQEVLETCRICFGGDNYRDNSEDLIKSPCNCSGSMALIHASCLETWLTVSRRDKCEICQFTFETIRIFPPFKDYVRDSGNRVGLQLVTLVAELFSFLLPTVVLWLMAYQWYKDRHGDRGSNFFDGWESIVLFIGSCALLFVCFIWGKGTLRHYLYIWNVWKVSHVLIRLKVKNADYSENSDSETV